MDRSFDKRVITIERARKSNSSSWLRGLRPNASWERRIALAQGKQYALAQSALPRQNTQFSQVRLDGAQIRMAGLKSK